MKTKIIIIVFSLSIIVILALPSIDNWYQHKNHRSSSTVLKLVTIGDFVLHELESSTETPFVNYSYGNPCCGSTCQKNYKHDTFDKKRFPHTSYSFSNTKYYENDCCTYTISNHSQCFRIEAHGNIDCEGDHTIAYFDICQNNEGEWDRHPVKMLP